MNTENKKQNTRKWSTGPGTFAGMTLAAILMAVIMVVLGRVSLPQAAGIPPSILQSSAALPVSPAVPPTAPVQTTAPPSSTPGTVSPVPRDSLVTSKGSANAPITIIEYSDFQCGHCQQFAIMVEPELEAAYVNTGKVQVIYHFMNVYDAESQLANEAAACAAEQGQFWLYYYMLMQLRTSPTKEDLSIEVLQGLAQQWGFDMDKFNNSLLSHKFADLVKQEDAAGREQGVTGTPTFFINGIRKDGALALADLQAIIDPMLLEEAQ